MRRVLFILLIAVLLQLSIASDFHAGVNQVVSSLGQFQAENGGFRSERDPEPSLMSTSNALFLATLFGQTNLINENVQGFIESLQNPDFGFANKAGQQSSLDATRYALLGLSNIGSSLPDTNGVKSFVKSKFDSESGLYFNSTNVPTVRATFDALDILRQIDSLNSAKLESIRSAVEKLKHIDSGITVFSSNVADNAYAILVAFLSGFKFENTEEYAIFFIENQAPNGGFFIESGSRQVGIESTELSIAALIALEKAGGHPEGYFVEKLDNDALYEFIHLLPRDLYTAASIYRGVAATSSISKVIQFQSKYVSNRRKNVQNDHILVGSPIRPKLQARSSFGILHTGFDVTVRIADASNKVETYTLKWSDDKQLYECEEQFKANNLGEVTFDFEIKTYVAELGRDVSFSISETKRVGYDVVVTPTATLAGKEIATGEEIGIGTFFTFDLDVKGENVNDVVDFIVTSSSGMKIHSESKKLGSKSLEFQYSLDNSDIPAGLITFTFGVKSQKDKPYHTMVSHSYYLPVQMIVSDVSFSKPERKYQVGDNIVVTATPGVLVDLVNPTPFDYNKDNNVEVTMNVYNANGRNLLFKVPGTAENNKGKLIYKFAFEVEPTFYHIGEHVVVFTYQPVFGNEIALYNYNTETGELLDESSPVLYNVNAELHVAEESNALKSGQLTYGNKVQFSFKVKDTVSGRYIIPNENSVKLLLKYTEGDRTFTSSEQVAFVNRDKFDLEWTVDPNAIKGDGVVELVTITSNGEIGLLKEKSGELWSVPVSIGGEIDHDHVSYSGEIDEQTTVFLVAFELRCENARLDGAKLVAKIYNQQGDLIEINPVSRSSIPGAYQISWALPRENARSGDYRVEVFRSADLQTGEEEALFTVTHTHEETVDNTALIPTDFIVLLVLVGFFGKLVWTKMEVEGLRKKR